MSRPILRASLPLLFPSPRGDKLCRSRSNLRSEQSGFRPLAGISCVFLKSGRRIKMIVSVPSRGKLCRLTLRIIVRGMEFPSPRGDKLCLAEIWLERCRQSFPSPRGDKLCPVIEIAVGGKSVGFRPLAGISCVYTAPGNTHPMPRFPSPRGDKLCRQLTAAVLFGDQFPSPRGDKLCHRAHYRPHRGIHVSVPSRG